MLLKQLVFPLTSGLHFERDIAFVLTAGLNFCRTIIELQFNYMDLQVAYDYRLARFYMWAQIEDKIFVAMHIPTGKPLQVGFSSPMSLRKSPLPGNPTKMSFYTKCSSTRELIIEP